jgi:hypothetical protein
MVVDTFAREEGVAESTVELPEVAWGGGSSGYVSLLYGMSRRYRQS